MHHRAGNLSFYFQRQNCKKRCGSGQMGLKRRPIKPLAVAWQQQHLDSSPLRQLKQPRRTPGLLPAPPRIALSRLCRAPLDKGPSGSPTSTASKKKPTPWGASCRLRRSTESTMYSLNSSVGSFAYLIPKCVVAAAPLLLISEQRDAYALSRFTAAMSSASLITG